MQQDSSRKIGKTIAKYLIELLIVAFGVFLGIYFGDYNNQKKVDANTINALNQIISEIDMNSARLEEAIEYHRKVDVEIDSATNLLEQKDLEAPYYSNTKFQFNDLPSWTGVKTAILSKTIYESAKISGAFQEFNLSTINSISEVYEYQKLYDDFSETVLDKFVNFDSNARTTDIVGLLKTISKYDVVNIEKGLLEGMRKSSKELKTIRDNNDFKK